MFFCRLLRLTVQITLGALNPGHLHPSIHPTENPIPSLRLDSRLALNCHQPNPKRFFVAMDLPAAVVAGSSTVLVNLTIAQSTPIDPFGN